MSTLPKPNRLLPCSRVELEALVDAAIAALDAMDGDADIEPECEDEGAACEDEGFDADREPDLDGDGRPEPAWMIGSRPAIAVNGIAAEWVVLDLDDASDTIGSPRVEWGMAG